MKRVAVFYDPVYLQHDTGAHPENSGRLVSIVSALKTAPFQDYFCWKTPSPARLDHIAANHNSDYIGYVKKQCRSGAMSMDMDTVICKNSWDSALMAAGAVVDAVDGVMIGEFSKAFCAVRPPGHHAEADKAMGFCLFNNIAIGARHAINVHKLERVAIIDFDVHHGNGTQSSFYNDPSVFYISLHQEYHYPGTGMENETGDGAAVGTNLNFPMPAGAGNEEMLAKFDDIIIPTLRKYRPEILFISAGFDAHTDDPLAGLEVTCEGFGAMTERINSLSDELGHGRVISALEGGYNLNALRESTVAHVSALICY